LNPQENLWNAFGAGSLKQFDHRLKMGANAEEIVELDTQSSTFDLLCQDPKASDYIIKCLEYKTDPNKVSRSKNLLKKLINITLNFSKRKTLTMDTIQFIVLFKT
jgi:hypothetical protein